MERYFVDGKHQAFRVEGLCVVRTHQPFLAYGKHNWHKDCLVRWRNLGNQDNLVRNNPEPKRRLQEGENPALFGTSWSVDAFVRASAILPRHVEGRSVRACVRACFMGSMQFYV